ncbi:hypothetical protein C0J52_11750 [Blattella germanica]|nr:hypothetical protein C0J52_11750 [Blattella germanica]
MKYSNLTMRAQEAMSIGRAMRFNPTQVQKYVVARTLKLYNPHQIYNVNESGLSTVPTRLPKGLRRVSNVVSGERQFIPPFHLYPWKRMKPEFLAGNPPGTISWMIADMFIYLQHFVKYAKPSGTSPILLLLDNHASHVTLYAIDFCRNNHITMTYFSLVPHTDSSALM